MSGVIGLSRGVVTTPVKHIDIALPAGYESFQLFMDGYTCDDPTNFETICFLFSKDGGNTWWNDPTNGDTYLALYANGNSSAIATGVNKDSFLYTGSSWQPPTSKLYVPSQYRLDINPGDSSHGLSVRFSVALSYQANSPPNWAQFAQHVGYLNPNAVVTPVYARANLIRLKPTWGNGSPADDVFNFTSLSWSLQGVQI